MYGVFMTCRLCNYMGGGGGGDGIHDVSVYVGV